MFAGMLHFAEDAVPVSSIHCRGSGRRVGLYTGNKIIRFLSVSRLPLSPILLTVQW